MTPRTPCYASFVAIGACLALAASAQGQPVVHVDDTATGANDGSSWCDAYVQLQDALAAAAKSGGTISEIRVAQGIYRPDRDNANPSGTGDREATFQLLSGVALRGGYAGCGAPDPEDRNIAAYETILNGDLNDDDTGGPFDYVDDQINPTRNDNTNHVVTALDVAASTILDGFTITGGNADELTGWPRPPNTGGGIYVSGGAPTLINCTIAGNWARGLGHGGGMSCTDDASPIVVNSTFRANFADVGGGGIYTSRGQLALTGCSFVGNAVVSAGGGGLYNDGGRVTATNCIFNGNDGGSHYGGAILDEGITTLTNCILTNNWARQRGGAIYGAGYLSNCTVTNNRAMWVGGLYTLGGAVVRNCILWGNSEFKFTAPHLHSQIGPFTPTGVDYSCVQGWTGDLEGVGNIGDDPLFVPGPGGCFYLSQTAARQAKQSPCVDAGSDTAAILELDSVTTRSDEVADTGIGDMGYHYPITGKTLIMGDFDRNQRVDLRDFADFQRCFTGGSVTNVTPCCRIFDFEADADVDLNDAASFQVAVTGP